MSPALCKTHFREVANYFDKEIALAYGLDDQSCVICSKEIFIEGARRLVDHSTHFKAIDNLLRLPDEYAHFGA